MLSPKLASRYAKSIFDLSKEKNILKEVLEDMNLLSDTIKQSKELQLLLKSPIVTSDKKDKILGLIFKGKLSDITFTFMELLVKKGRESTLPEMANSFIEKYNKLNHVVIAQLTTAVEVDKNIVDKVEKILLAIDGNKSVQLETKVDPDIVGGFVLKYGDKLLDDSISRKLHLIKKDIIDSSYIQKYS
jgi:F-type H+-transporting ATPase subunit delta